MKRKRREQEIFSLYFLDGMCCAFGAVIMLLLITKAAEPRIIEQAKVQERGLIAALQKELFQIRGETDVLDRHMRSAEGDRKRAEQTLARLQADLSKVRGQFAASKEVAIDSELEGELRATRQSLTEEMRRLLADYTRPKEDLPVAGVPVDSEYIIFVIDTSGSMQEGAWPLVQKKMAEALNIYPRVKGIQVMDDNGGYLFRDTAGKWMIDSPGRRTAILRAVANWSPFSDSNPTDGIEIAVRTFYQPDRRISIYFLGDDFQTGRAVEGAIRYIENVNRPDAAGNRPVRIHAIGFPVQLAAGNPVGFSRFANLMRALSTRNGGSFVAVPEVAFQRSRVEIRGPGFPGP